MRARRTACRYRHSFLQSGTPTGRLEQARSGIVLLKNSGNLLPLNECKVTTIAVIGPDAYPAVISGGGSAETKPFNAVSFLEGISNRLGASAKVLYAVDVPPLEEVFDKPGFLTCA